MDAAQPKSGFEKKWHFARYATYLALASWFCIVAFLLGPRWILFRRFTWIEPADFTAEVMRTSRPLLEAIGQYRRDYGTLPTDNAIGETLFKLSSFNSPHIYENKLRIRLSTRWNHVLIYDLERNDGVWRVAGEFTRGEVPTSESFRSATTQALHR